MLFLFTLFYMKTGTKLLLICMTKLPVAVKIVPYLILTVLKTETALQQ